MNNFWIRDDLTKKQTEYLADIASGKNTLEIAQNHFISHHTVRNTIAKAKERVGAKSTAHLVAMAVEKSWIISSEKGFESKWES